MVKLICRNGIGGLTVLLLACSPSFAQTYTVAPGQTTTISGLITDGTTPTPLTVTGGGTLVLSNALNSYSGGTNVFGGSTLKVDTDSEMGPSTAGIALGDASARGTLSLINSSAFTSARGIILNSGGGVILATSTAAGANFAGAISGTGNLTIGGGGIVALTAVNSYTGSTLLTGGTILQIAADTALGGYTTTSSTNAITLVVTNINTLTTVSPLTIDGGTLQFIGAAAIAHPITLTSNNAIFDSNGNNASISANISGPGSLTKIGTGTLALNGTNIYSGGTTISAGTLAVGDNANPKATLAGAVAVGSGATLAGTGMVQGTVTNGGTLSSGYAWTGGLTVGNLTQTANGMVNIPVTTTGVGTLRVLGTANLAGTLNINYGSGFLHPGTYQLLTAANTTGAFAAVTGAVPSAALSQTITNGPGFIDVTLTQLTTLPDRPTIFPALATTAIDAGQQANQTLLSRLSDSRTLALVDGMNAALVPSHRVRSESPYGLWVAPTGNFGTVKSNGQDPGFKTDGFGMMTGIDADLATGFAAGLAFGFDRSVVNETGGARGTLMEPRIAVYGDWWRGPLAIDAVTTVSFPSFDSNRTIPHLSEIAKESHGGSELTAAMQASLGFLVGKWSITPAAGAKYLFLSENQYGEHGTDIYNFTVLGTHFTSLRPFADASVSHRFDIGSRSALIPQVTLGYENEMLKGNRNVTVQTQGDAANWVINGVPAAHGAVTMDAELSLETDKAKSFYLGYDRRQSSESMNDIFTAGFRYRL